MSITKEGLFRYQALNERQRKNLVILDMISKRGPIAKADLAKNLHYNLVTLSNHMDEYLKKKIICERGLDVSTGGRRPVLAEVNKEAGLLIGIDFNKENLCGVLTDLSLNVISEAKYPRPPIDQEEVQQALITLIKDLIKKSGAQASDIKFAAAGVYGTIIEKNGTIKDMDEEKGRSRATIYFIKLRDAIEKTLGIRAFFGSDAAFAAFGEHAKNTNADTENMLYIFQDVGKGVIIKGDVYCSTNIGGIDLEGLTGTLTEEEKVKLSDESLYLRPWNAEMSLKKEAMKVVESGVGTKIVEILNGDISSLNDDIIIKAAKNKDDVAIELIEGIGINLGVRISYLVNLFSPQVVVVGGGIEKAGDILFDQINHTVEKLSLDKVNKNIRIFPSVLGDKAVSLGAASVALREVFMEA